MKNISIFAWILRVSFIPFLMGVLTTGTASYFIWSAGEFENSPYVPIHLAFGVAPWFVILLVGVGFIIYAWMNARGWQHIDMLRRAENDR